MYMYMCVFTHLGQFWQSILVLINKCMFIVLDDVAAKYLCRMNDYVTSLTECLSRSLAIDIDYIMLYLCHF